MHLTALVVVVTAGLANAQTGLYEMVQRDCGTFAVSGEDRCGFGCHPEGETCPERVLAAKLCAHTAVRTVACSEGCVAVDETFSQWVAGQASAAAGNRRLLQDPQAQGTVELENALFQGSRYACVPRSRDEGSCSRPADALLQSMCSNIQRVNSAMLNPVQTTSPRCPTCPSCAAPTPVMKFRIQGVRFDARNKEQVCVQANGKFPSKLVLCDPEVPQQEWKVTAMNDLWMIENVFNGKCLKHDGKIGPCTREDVFEAVPVVKWRGYRLRMPSGSGEYANKCLQGTYPAKKQVKAKNLLKPGACQAQGVPKQKALVFTLNPVL